MTPGELARLKGIKEEHSTIRLYKSSEHCEKKDDTEHTEKRHTPSEEVDEICLDLFDEEVCEECNFDNAHCDIPWLIQKIEELEAHIKSAKASAWDEALDDAFSAREITYEEFSLYLYAKENNPYKENKK